MFFDIQIAPNIASYGPTNSAPMSFLPVSINLGVLPCFLAPDVTLNLPCLDPDSAVSQRNKRHIFAANGIWKLGSRC